MNKTQIYVVTGANSGIGLAITKALVEKGHFVYGCDISSDSLKSLENTGLCKALHVNVTNNEDISKAVDTIATKLEAGQGVDGLVNCAGIARAGPIVHFKEEDLKLIFEINVFGIFRMVKALFPLLVKNKGRIVNISSLSGLFAFPFMAPYSMTKHAVEAYSDALRRELQPFGMKVVIIEPGKIITPLLDKTKKMNKEGFQSIDPLFRERAVRMAEYDESRVKTSALPVDIVVSKILEGLFSKKPKTRYLIVKNPLKTKLMLLMPDRSIDDKMMNI